jgi:hypothetical protein
MSKAHILALVALCIYGDLMKRFLSPNMALMALYVLAGGLLYRSWWVARNSAPLQLSQVGAAFQLTTRSTILLYVVWAVISMLMVRTIDVASASLYVILPLAYIDYALVHGHRFPRGLFCLVVPIMMLPVHGVAIVQRFVDSSFLISTAYAESGGIIHRNLLGAGSFDRLPSIYTGADRYSALSLLQALFAIEAAALVRSRRGSLLSLASLTTAVGGLLISGARSRILLLLALVPVVLFFAPRVRRLSNFLMLVLGAAIATVALVLILGISTEQVTERLKVIDFLVDSARQGDIVDRLKQALSTLIIPDEATLFGLGLGSDAGKPREFAMHGFWIENGIVGGAVFIFMFMVMIALLGIVGYSGVKERSFMISFAAWSCALILLMGVLTGLTGVLEISSGVLLCLYCGQTVAIATGTRTDAVRMPQRRPESERGPAK